MSDSMYHYISLLIDNIHIHFYEDNQREDCIYIISSNQSDNNIFNHYYYVGKNKTSLNHLDARICIIHRILIYIMK